MSWQQQKIKAETEVAHRYFYDTGCCTTAPQLVPLAQVTGSFYGDDYVGETWEHMRQHLRRRVITEANCDAWIDFPELHGADALAFGRFDQEYFICCGHHRTCIARFQGREMVPAQVTTYAFDHALFALYQQLTRVGFRVDLHGTPTSNRYHPVWQLTSAGNLALTLYGRAGIRSFAAYYAQLGARGWRRGLTRLSRWYQPACPAGHWLASQPAPKWSLWWSLLRHWHLTKSR